jgi:hypothetical protein
MKYLQKIVVFVCLACGIFACGTRERSNNAEIKFKTTEINFGKLEFNGNGNCSFIFTNPGNTPLVIQHVKTSCGCTVPEWPNKPIKPGKTSEIKINYDTKHPGAFNKTITVFYNGKNSPATLFIKGDVEYPKEMSSEI